MPALLSLPHAVSVIAAIAAADRPSERRADALANAVELHLSHFRLTALNSPATYAAAVDRARMESERAVNRSS